MSKLTKLIFTPRKFFTDINKKQSANNEAKIIATLPKRVQPAKVLPIKPLPVSPTIIQNDLWKSFKIAIHTGEGLTQGGAHLSLWLPDFIKSGVLFCILVRDLKLYEWIKVEFPSVSICYAKNPLDVENLLNSNSFSFLKGIFYMSNTGNNIHCIRFNSYKHVFIGHGDSDKSASAHKVFRMYDEVWVAGQAHEDRFKNAEFETNHIKFVRVGRPNLYSLIKNTATAWNMRLAPKIIYLPTWEGVYEDSNYSSLRISQQLLICLVNKFNIKASAKLHPATGTRDKSIGNLGEQIQLAATQNGVQIEIKSKTAKIDECIQDANLYLCDISAVVSECLSANGPIFVYIPNDRTISISQSDMIYSDYCYTYSTIDELLEKMDAVLNGDDYLAEKRNTAIEYFLSKSKILEKAFEKELNYISSENEFIHNSINKIEN